MDRYPVGLYLRDPEARVGATPDEVPGMTLEGFRIDVPAVLALGDEWALDPEGSYCPVSDIHCSVRGLGVFFPGDGRCYVTADNGFCLVTFRLSKWDRVKKVFRKR